MSVEDPQDLGELGESYVRSEGATLMRVDLDPPLVLLPGQLREMAGMIENGIPRQTIYAYMTDGSGDILVGQEDPSTPPEEAGGDGVWMNSKGAEMHGPAGFADGTVMGGRHDDPPLDVRDDEVKQYDAEAEAEEIEHGLAELEEGSE